jgi:tRNA-(ms[2]io[6]A)-hydroxylase
MFDLRTATPSAWLDAVFADFGSFLIDHAACERKASATGMMFVVRYPDRESLLEPLIAFAREELEHFHIVYRLLAARGLVLGADYRDEYVNALLGRARPGGDALLMDRLLIAGVVEARGCERLGMVASTLPERDPGLAETYEELTRAEARHRALFFRLARDLFGEAATRARADELLDFEAEVVRGLPLRAAVH